MSNVEFGAWLKEQREKRHLTQTELAIILGVQSAHISRIESGGRGASAELLVRAADYFRYSVEDVVRMATGMRTAKKLSEDIVKRIERKVGSYRRKETQERALELLDLLAIQEEQAEYATTSQKKTPTPKAP